MKKILLVVPIFIFIFSFCGCESSDDYNDTENRRYSYERSGRSYDWVAVNVENQSSQTIVVYKGYAIHRTLRPGESTTVTSKLLGDQELYVGIRAPSYAEGQSFDREYYQYNYVAYDDHASRYP